MSNARSTPTQLRRAPPPAVTISPANELIAIDRPRHTPADREGRGVDRPRVRTASASRPDQADRVADDVMRLIEQHRCRPSIGMPWKYQRLMASMLRFVTARIGTSVATRNRTARTALRSSIASTTNATPAAAAHGLHAEQRAPCRRGRRRTTASIEIDRISSSSSSVAHAPANRYCTPISTCGIQ